MNDFLKALLNVGIDPNGQLVEGQLTRATCSCSPHKKNRSGTAFYTYYSDNPTQIKWGCWKEGCPNSPGGKFSPKSGKALLPEEREIIKARIEKNRHERETLRVEVESAVKEKAARLDMIGGDVLASHPYLVNHDIKSDNIKPVGIKQLKDMLLIPMSVTGTGTPASMQLIFPDGRKRFLTGTGAI